MLTRTHLSPSSGFAPTHEVRNQAQPASGFNAFTEDAVLSAAIARDAPWAAARCAALGAVAGDEAVQELARLANRHLPRAADPRPVWQPGGLGGIPSRLAPADGTGLAARGAQPQLAHQ